MRNAKRISGSIIIFLLSLFLADQAFALKTFAPDGPYPVGVRIDRLQLKDRTAPVMVWYPAETNPGPVYKYTDKLEGAARLNAPVKKSGAPYPLLLFSHGMGACACQSVYYTENLASFGYVVVAPDHKDSAMCHIDGPPDITVGQIAKAALKSGGDLSQTVFGLFRSKFEELGYDFSYRPIEAKAAIDLALAWNRDRSSPFFGIMDPDRIGATGHSLGGYTTMMVGGVPFHCEGSAPGPEQCQTDKISLTDNINPCCMKYLQGKDPFAARDPRVKAMLPLGPAVFFPKLEQAAKEITIPVMIITGDNHKMEVPWERIRTFYQNAPAPKYLIRLRKTDHLTISDLTLSSSFLTRLLLPGFRDHYREKAQAAKDYSVAFFNKYLKADNSQSQVLEKASNPVVELWFEK